MFFLIVGEEYQQFFGEFFIADQVVVDKENVPDALFPQGIQLSAHLFNGFGARLPTEHDNDVTEFTTVGATS